MTPALLNNRYRISKALGRGGFGHTYLAIDTHMPSGRQCVIKQLKPISQQPQMYQWVQKRFGREAAILEAIGEGSKQIPKLYAYFSEAGTFYLVQEWIDGVTLTQKLDQEGTLSQEEVREILVSLLEVLQYVHSNHLIHRDVKPDNIILRASDGVPVLIDFGGVKEAMGTVLTAQGNVTSSMAIGTPGYMPPEQAAGRPVYSSDLYSLGLTGVYLLTGKTPLQLGTDSGTGEILWREEVPNLHSHLAGVIDRSIRYHPRDRFATATEMLAALLYPAGALTQSTVAVSSGNSPQTTNHPSKPVATTVAVPSTPATRKQGTKFWLAALLLGAVALTAVAVGFQLLQQVDEPTPRIASSPEPESEQTTPQPSPSPIPPVESPQASPPPSPPPPQENPTRLTGVPTFTTGTPESTIQEALGNPSVSRKGYWPNTRAVTYYDFIPNQVDLGYLFDLNTGLLRQSEVSFTQSVDLQLMQSTLDQLFGGNAPASAQRGLQEVYNRQADLRSFSAGQLKGLIQRNQSDRIYIGVWESDLH